MTQMKRIGAFGVIVALMIGGCSSNDSDQANKVRSAKAAQDLRAKEHTEAEAAYKRAEDSFCTLDDFDKRYGAASAEIYKGNFAAAEKEFLFLHSAASGYYGANPRLGRVLTYIALCQLTHNQPEKAQVSVEEAMRNSKSLGDPMADLSADYALLGLCKELRGDTASGVLDYNRGFKLEPFHPGEVLSLVATGMQKNGFIDSAKVVVDRIKWYKSQPQFRIIPLNALQFVQLANEQQRNGHSAKSDDTRLKGLSHLESSKNLTDLDELRGAFQLFKFYRRARKADLAERALKQMRMIGERTPTGKIQLRQALRYERVPYP